MVSYTEYTDHTPVVLSEWSVWTKKHEFNLYGEEEDC